MAASTRFWTCRDAAAVECGCAWFLFVSWRGGGIVLVDHDGDECAGCGCWLRRCATDGDDGMCRRRMTLDFLCSIFALACLPTKL